ncbi:sulfatase-like hydrolase/transferase [Halosquirtibacter xylanolyticus]|uniref:sulfatase-like hydrolase/transferase n=1 Tax=Halosquirtibacter xylanolyticus TaxID=3374599 RepID=UPI0037494FF2|nr:sulfatase-like hydrolase/transferase [Prolixibacteraceae bacterium]
MKNTFKTLLTGMAITSTLVPVYGAQANKKHSKKPNVLIIYTDDQATLDAGCYGTKDISTPNIDKLASKGVRFTQAYAHTVCCPSRAALLTGRQPQRGGVNTWTSCHPKDQDGRKLNLNEVTIAEQLKDNGYTTGLVGKWHLGAQPGYGPLQQGFDYFFGFRGGFIDYYTHTFLHAGWERPTFHDLFRNDTEIFENGKYFPDLQVKEANKFMEQNKDNPFFLYVAMNLPHYPEQPDSTFIDQYKDMPWPRKSYAPMITTVDDRIGKILKKLKKLGLEDNTIVIYMSDNGHSTEDYYNWGDSYGANGGGGYTGKWRGAKGSFFEGGLRVPCIIKYPKKIAQGQVRKQAISNLDFFPTICELTNTSLPNKKLDGNSIVPILNSDKAKSKHDTMYWMWQNMWAVKKGDWKLIYKGHDTTGKYSNHPALEFDMPEYWLANLTDKNPEETNYASAHPEIVKELTALHETWATDVFDGSGYTDPNKVTEEDKKKTKGSTKL